MFLGELAVGRFDFGRAGVSLHTQDLVGVSHGSEQ
jgi:hypothetical protein